MEIGSLSVRLWPRMDNAVEPIVSHIEITVRDMQEAVPFYDKLLPLFGYDLAQRSSAQFAAHDKHVVLRTPSTGDRNYVTASRVCT